MSKGIEYPLVSIYCATYNHEKYIRQALDSFIDQKTTFPYEIIVHDDASTDGTGRILDEYQERYPDLISVIHQSVNQYQQGVKIFFTFIKDIIKGKYVAFCEGDDYWNDQNKLQLQLDYLEKHPTCSACVHNTTIYNMKTGRSKPFSCIKKETDISLDVLLDPHANVYHTSSLVYRVEDIEPSRQLSCLVPNIGDYPKRVYFATKGTVHFINKTMSTYRFLVPGSWSVRRIRDNSAKVNDCRNIIAMLEAADKNSLYKYHDNIQAAIADEQFTLLTIEGRYKELFKSPYNKIFIRKRSLLEKVRILIGCVSPRLVDFIINKLS